MRLEIFDDTYLGERERNEDYSLADPDRGLLLIADGMGGGDCGDRAARLACQTALEVWTESAADYDGLDRVRFVLRRVNKVVYECGRQERLDLGATLTLAAVDEHQLLVGHVGDTRLYRLRDDRAELLTRDQRALGNQLQASIGGSDMVDPFAEAYDHKPGDVLLLATDGLWEFFKKPGALEKKSRSVPPNELGGVLMSVASEYAQDNASVVVAWDAEAIRRWWLNRAASLRDRLKQKPDRETWDTLLQALDAANEPIKGVDEFNDAWQPSIDTALVGLAVAVLEPADQEALFATLAQDRGSIAALLALADRYQEASDVGERARQWVLRAFDHEPTLERAAWILQAHRGTRLDPKRFDRLARCVLDRSPGPWFDVWTQLWELWENMFMQSPADRDVADVARTVLQNLSASLSFPGSALLGQRQASHPVDRIWCAVLDKMLTPVVELQALGEELRSRLQTLEQSVNHLGQQSGRQKEELERVEQGIEPLCKQIQDTREHLQSIKGLLDAGSKETDDRMTALRRDIGRLSDRLMAVEAVENQLKRQIGLIEKATNPPVVQPFQPPHEPTHFRRVYNTIISYYHNNSISIRPLLTILLALIVIVVLYLWFL